MVCSFSLALRRRMKASNSKANKSSQARVFRKRFIGSRFKCLSANQRIQGFRFFFLKCLKYLYVAHSINSRLVAAMIRQVYFRMVSIVQSFRFKGLSDNQRIQGSRLGISIPIGVLGRGRCADSRR